MIRTRTPSVTPAVAALLAGLVVLATSLLPTTAWAHAGLVGSDPEDGATIEQFEGEITLTFSEDVREPATVIVTDPDGTGLQTGEALVEGTAVTQQVDRATVSGMHTIAYRVISADGHPVTGQVQVTVEATSSAEGVPDPTPSASESPSQDASPDAEESGEADATDNGVAWWIPAAVVVVLLLAGAAFLASRRKQK